MPQFDKSLVWFRRDLRCFDHAALHHALKESRSVYCAFIFDNEFLATLPRQDRRVEFILASAAELDAELRRHGGHLIVRHGNAVTEIPKLAKQLRVDAVFANHDYEPQATARDESVARQLREAGSSWYSFKDQVVFEKDEVLSQSGKPFSVFTPYKNAWLKKLDDGGKDFFLKPYPCMSRFDRLAAPTGAASLPELADIGFEKTNLAQLSIPTGMSGGKTLSAGKVHSTLPAATCRTSRQIHSRPLAGTGRPTGVGWCRDRQGLPGSDHPA